jgi:hypothetical protein
MEPDVWVGDLSAMLHGMRLVVRERDGFARYLLLAGPRQEAGQSEVLLESGSEDHVDATKERAVRRAADVAGILNGASYGVGRR